ncbi:MAG: lytic transglycosylase domain-containing protein, partial [Boseongicola sp.]|nr:lytic transglycosylase domain-containing protein [Boseongicola sp.]
MQLMPDTAKEVAAYLDLPYSSSRMLSDTYYNTRLGTAYLDELLEKYDGNVVLVAAAYNAGPGRADRWIDSLGDPRRSDMVDWIEHIPYSETRNYVMRVAEGALVYRARLGGRFGPVSLSREIASWQGHERAVRSGWSGWTAVRPRLRPSPLTD